MSGNLTTRFPLNTELPATAGVVLLGDNGVDKGDVPVEHFLLKTDKPEFLQETTAAAIEAAQVASAGIVEPAKEAAEQARDDARAAATAAGEAVDNAAKPLALYSEALADLPGKPTGYRYEVYADPPAPALYNSDGSNRNGYYMVQGSGLAYVSETVNSLSARSKDNPAFRITQESTEVTHYFTVNKKYVIAKIFKDGVQFTSLLARKLADKNIRLSHPDNATGLVVGPDGVKADVGLGFISGSMMRESADNENRMGYTFGQVSKLKRLLWAIGPRVARFAGIKMQWNLDGTYTWSDATGPFMSIDSAGIVTQRGQIVSNGAPRQGNPFLIIKGLRNRITALVFDANGYVKRKGMPDLVASGVPYNHYSKFGTIKADGSDESATVRAIHDAAETAGVRTLIFDNLNINAPTALDISQVIFEGEGKLINDNRKYMVPRSAPTKVASSRIKPKLQLPNKAPGDTCVVVFTGDSTIQANATIDTVLSPRAMIEREFVRQNPGVIFQFWDRAISSQRWDTLDNVSGTTPPWYSPSNRQWLDFIKDKAPDVVFIGFGMNDRAGLLPATINSVRNKLQAFPKVPKIVIMTCVTPTKKTVDYENNTLVEARMYAAGLERTYANVEGWGLLDFNEHMCAVRDGFGLIDQPLVSKAYGLAGQIPYIYADNCEEFAGHFYFANNPFVDGKVMALSLSSVAANLLMFRKGSTGLLEYRVQTDATNTQIDWTASTMRADYPDWRITIDVNNDGWLQILSNGYAGVPADSFARQETVFKGYVKRFGGLYKPRFGYFDAVNNVVDNSVLACTLTQIAIGEPRRFRQEITNKEMYDINGGVINNGNGINHMTAVGSQAIYLPVVKATDFHLNY